MPTLVHLRLPLPWDEFALPNPLATRATVLSTGAIGWAWDDAAPGLGIDEVVPVEGVGADGWDLDHVVLLVPSLDASVAALAAIGVDVRRRTELRGRQTAFFLVGTLLEVIESPSLDRPFLHGVALEVDDLDAAGARLRTRGLEVTDPRPAVQKGRKISTIQGLEAGVVIMSRRE